MLFPQVPVGELKVRDRFLDDDNREWTIFSMPSRFDSGRLVEVERFDPEIAGTRFSEILRCDKLVTINQMWAGLTAGRCRRCRVLYVWARRWRVRLGSARCPECNNSLVGTMPRLVKPGGLVDRAEFRCPLGG